LKKFAFTLAEVLITMSIIGVVTAITIPMIINYFQEIEYTSKFKESYSLISNATNKIKQENGGSLKGVFSISSTYSVEQTRTEYLKHLKYVKTCDTTEILGNCWYSGYAKRWDTGEIFSGTFLGNEPAWWSAAAARSVILANGTAIYFQNAGALLCDSSTACQRMFVDTNGLKEPNTMGKDIYYFFIYDDRVDPNPWNVQAQYGGTGAYMGRWRLMQ